MQLIEVTFQYIAVGHVSLTCVEKVQSLSRIGNHRETEWSVDFTKTIRLIVRSGCSVYNRAETDFLTRLNDDQNIGALFERAFEFTSSKGFCGGLEKVCSI
ncbi:hypothetical protein P8452_53442 [Trifolium repens]|nr:hypothetical protein P8452_53442 [Trifolium repens]